MRTMSFEITVNKSEEPQCTIANIQIYRWRTSIKNIPVFAENDLVGPLDTVYRFCSSKVLCDRGVTHISQDSNDSLGDDHIKLTSGNHEAIVHKCFTTISEYLSFECGTNIWVEHDSH